jgi:hypothetical protein
MPIFKRVALVRLLAAKTGRVVMTALIETSTFDMISTNVYSTVELFTQVDFPRRR